MTAAAYQEAIDSYGYPLHEFLVESMPAGLIHRTYKVTGKQTHDSFLLQQINHEVFADPGKMQQNYAMIWKHLDETASSFKIPEPKFFPGDETLYEDSQGNFWRVTEFVAGSTTFQTATSPEQAAKVAAAFAALTKALSGFDHALLNETIPGFHDPAYRFRQFLEAQRQSNIPPGDLHATLMNDIKMKERYVSFYEVLIQSPEFKRRVMHHDAKISNVLFDSRSGDVLCPVDFDTVMPGYIFSDPGDMIRSMAACCDEHDAGGSEPCIREDFYEAIVNTYLETLDDQLTGAEKKYIHFSGLLITYMQVLRYMTDYLNGNTYYQCSYPAQNLDRAKKQFELLGQLEKFLERQYGFSI